VGVECVGFVFVKPSALNIFELYACSEGYAKSVVEQLRNDLVNIFLFSFWLVIKNPDPPVFDLQNVDMTANTDAFNLVPVPDRNLDGDGVPVAA